jgi:hypothetical protein
VKYVLLIYSSDDPEPWEAMPAEERQAIRAEYEALSREPQAVGGAQLQPGDTATVVRVQNGQTLTTDGPFAETKEVLGGYFVIEAPDLDAALAMAERIPAARLGGAVEVRPLVEM